MAGNVRIPWKTIEKFSAIVDLEEYKRAVSEQLGNARPEIMLNRMFCAVFIGSKMLAETGPLSKLEKTQEAIAEDIWQGKVCLVIDAGPAAFVDDSMQSFYGQRAQAGDWISAKINNCTQIEVAGIPCRIVEDRYVEAKWPDPRKVW